MQLSIHPEITEKKRVEASNRAAHSAKRRTMSKRPAVARKSFGRGRFLPVLINTQSLNLRFEPLPRNRTYFPLLDLRSI